MNILALQSDYPILSLTQLSAPVETVEVPVVSIQLIEGIEAILRDEEEFVAPVIEEEEVVAAVLDEGEIVGVAGEEGEITGSVDEEQSIIGVFEDCEE